MKARWSKQSVIVATLAILVASPAIPLAQDTGSAMSGMAQQAAGTLTGDQQSAAKSALCSAVQSHFPNLASASPASLSDPSVMSTAASTFAGSTHLSLSSATDMLKRYVAQHATDIFTSCAAGSATSALPSNIPGAGNLPQIPKLPGRKHPAQRMRLISRAMPALLETLDLLAFRGFSRRIDSAEEVFGGHKFYSAARLQFEWSRGRVAQVAGTDVAAAQKPVLSENLVKPKVGISPMINIVRTDRTELATIEIVATCYPDPTATRIGLASFKQEMRGQNSGIRCDQIKGQ